MKEILHTQSREEFAVVAHVRGWLHNGTHCPLCLAQTQLSVARHTIDTIICG